MYSQRVTIRPNADQVASVRALLTQRVKATQAAGQQAALAELIAGRHTPEFTVTLLFSDVSAFEAARKRNQSDAAFQKFATKLASMSRKPASIELLEVLMPMPAAKAAPAARRKSK